MKKFIAFLAALMCVGPAWSKPQVSGGQNQARTQSYEIIFKTGDTEATDAIPVSGFCVVRYQQAGGDDAELWAVPTSATAATSGTQIGTDFTASTTDATTFTAGTRWVKALATDATVGGSVLTIECAPMTGSGGGGVLGDGPFAEMDAVTNASSGDLWLLTDDNNAGAACDAGGGATNVWCGWNGSAWVPIGIAGGGLTAVSDDATPSLGGDLDADSKDITNPDAIGARIYYASTEAEINAAMTRCGTTGIGDNNDPQGCIIQLEGGVIDIAASLALSNATAATGGRVGLVFRGAGGGPNVTSTTNLQNAGTILNWTGAGDSVIDVGVCVGCELYGFSIDGNDQATSGIEVLSTTGSPAKIAVHHVGMWDINGSAVLGNTSTGQFDESSFSHMFIRDSTKCFSLRHSQSLSIEIGPQFVCTHMNGTGPFIDITAGAGIIHDSYCGISTNSSTCIEIENTSGDWSIVNNHFEAAGYTAPVFIDADDGSNGNVKVISVRDNKFVIDASSTTPVAFDYFGRGVVEFANNVYGDAETDALAVTIDVPSSNVLQAYIGGNTKNITGAVGFRWIPTIDTEALVQSPIVSNATLPTTCAWWEVGRDTDATAGAQLYSCESGSWVLNDGAAINGDGTATYVPYYSDADTLTSEAAFNYTAGSNTLAAGVVQGTSELVAGDTVNGVVKLNEGTGANFQSFATPTLAADLEYTLPNGYGTATYQLTTGGDGTLTWEAAGGAGSGYATIDDEDTPVTQRTTLNFEGAGVSCADDTDQTTCTIAGGGSTDPDDFTNDTSDDDFLDVAVGGTGVGTLTDGGILIGNGTGDLVALGVATNGQIPMGDGTTDPVLNEIDGTANEIEITNGAGTITVGIPSAPTLTGNTTVTGNLTVDGTGTSDFDGAVTAPSFTADATGTPSVTFDDSVDAGTEAQITADAVAADNGRIVMDVEQAAADYYSGVILKSTAGAVTLELGGDAGANFIQVAEGGVLTGEGTATIEAAALTGAIPTGVTAVLAAANDNDTSVATTSFVQQEIDDVDLLSDNCALENDATPIPDSCVGDGSDAGTGSVTWDTIGDATGVGSVDFAGNDQDIVSAEDGGDILTITNTDADHASDSIITRLASNDASGDANLIYLRATADADGTPTTEFNLAATTDVGGITMTLGSAGVVASTDGDGALTLLGAGNGSDESLTINLDDTANVIGISSGTSATVIDTGTMTIDAPAKVASSTGGTLSTNTITLATAAADYDLPDECDSATGAWATIIVRDASETVSITTLDTSDVFSYKGIATLVANDEMDSPGAALDSVTFVCMAADSWIATANSGSWTDGGTAD